MLKRLLKTGIVIVAAFLLIPAGLMAAQFKGKIQSISKKAKTIQVLNLKTKKIEVIRFGDKTQFINAKSIKEFIPKDVILVDYEHGKAATSIKRVLVELPPEKIIKTQEIAKLLRWICFQRIRTDFLSFIAGALPEVLVRNPPVWRKKRVTRMSKSMLTGHLHGKKPRS